MPPSTQPSKGKRPHEINRGIWFQDRQTHHIDLEIQRLTNIQAASTQESLARVIARSLYYYVMTRPSTPYIRQKLQEHWQTAKSVRFNNDIGGILLSEHIRIRADAITWSYFRATLLVQGRKVNKRTQEWVLGIFLAEAGTDEYLREEARKFMEKYYPNEKLYDVPIIEGIIEIGR